MQEDENKELIDQLEIWLNLSTAREQRQYLESHLNLLNLRSDSIVRDLLAQTSEASDQAQRLRESLMLLQDVRMHGGTVEAIREAYINIYGGFSLDLPIWLEEVERRLIELLNENRPAETAERRVELLQEALNCLQKDSAYDPALLVTLRRELAAAWVSNPLATVQTLESAISSYEEALRFYTLAHYPIQYARVQNTLGIAYLKRIDGERRENLEQAIACYREALRVPMLDTFPFQYARVQNNLGDTYRDRIAGERRENLEQAILCFREALRIWTLEAFPIQYAMAQNNLGIAYHDRIAGERRENLERAVSCYHEALRIWTIDTSPFYYAIVQNNLGVTYRDRIVGERRENLEQAIACYHEALRVHTLDAFPFQYAMALNGLGTAYLLRIAGERRENLEQAIACQLEALRIRKLDAIPFYYAEAQKDLGDAYIQRIDGERQENLEQAIICYHEALRVYTVEAFPREARDVHLHLAEIEAQRGNWEAAQNSYRTALEAEDLLVILGTSTLGRDAILKEGRDIAIRNGYVLYRLGRLAEAAVALEYGRARGLAEAMALDAADPALITDNERRTRYSTARAALIEAQAALHALSSQDLHEEARSRMELDLTVAYRQAKAAFDASVAEVRAACDPSNFLNTTLNASTIIYAAERIGPGHALVYLVSTPWGGVAVAALNLPSNEAYASCFAVLDLPSATEAWVNGLVERHLEGGSKRFIGGFALAQIGKGFERVCQEWDGETFQIKAKALRTACQKTRQVSTMVDAIQEAMRCAPFARLAKQPLALLTQEEHSLLSATFDQLFLQYELDHCMKQLEAVLMQPLIVWVQELGATGLTLIPCGSLSAFPLGAVVLPDGRSVGEVLPTSIAPSARSLLHTVAPRSPQAGVYALGDPHDNLPWSEAEALTISTLARRSALPTKWHVKRQATRERLLTALSSYWMVDASCHGTFDPRDFLQSALHLAQGDRLSMAELLSHQTDVRGLRLLLLSACQTALLDLDGAPNEVHSLAAAMLQAGAHAVVAAQWPVDDLATYLLMVRFAQEWLAHLQQEPPATALARAQAWLRNVTNAELAGWRSTIPTPSKVRRLISASFSRRLEHNGIHTVTRKWQRVPVRGRQIRFVEDEAQLIVRLEAEQYAPSSRPYASPYYWAGFQVIGW